VRVSFTERNLLPAYLKDICEESKNYQKQLQSILEISQLTSYVPLEEEK